MLFCWPSAQLLRPLGHAVLSGCCLLASSLQTFSHLQTLCSFAASYSSCKGEER